MKGHKLRAALDARIASYNALPSGGGGFKVTGGGSKAHKPGSQNVKKGYGGTRSGR